MLASSGYLAQVDEGLCIGCEGCQDACQFNAIQTDSGFAVVNIEDCMGCGVCEAHCEQGAITLVLDERKGIPLEINALVG